MEVVEQFRGIDARMQAQTIQTFLWVAGHDDMPMKDLSDALHISQSSVSRNVSALSKWLRTHDAGPDLVEAYEDPFERRRKIVRLTPRGKKLAGRVEEIMNRPRRTKE